MAESKVLKAEEVKPFPLQIHTYIPTYNTAAQSALSCCELTLLNTAIWAGLCTGVKSELWGNLRKQESGSWNQPGQESTHRVHQLHQRKRENMTLTIMNKARMEAPLWAQKLKDLKTNSRKS